MGCIFKHLNENTVSDQLFPVRELTALLSTAAPGSRFAGDCQGGPVFSCFEKAAAKAREAWALAAFSDVSAEVLRRYFNYQLREINGLFDLFGTAPVPGDLDCLIALTDHLDTYFCTYLDRNIAAPVLFVRYRLSAMRGSYDALMEMMDMAAVNRKLCSCLLACFSQYFAPGSSLELTFGTLDYISLLLRELMAVLKAEDQGDVDGALTRKLLGMNFNHFGYFDYLKDQVMDEIKDLSLSMQHAALLEKAAGFQLEQGNCKLGYDPQWPPIAMMFKAWMKDMSLAIEQQLALQYARPESFFEKIGLTLSVAQMAFVIGLFFDEGLYVSSNLAEIFRLNAQHFSSKKQVAISAGSLSQQYYSCTQATAGKVKAILVRMVANINKHYFPVMAAISVAIFCR
jgi:hypothetical protein